MVNGIARIHFKANTRTDLRVYVRPSCATASPCSVCDDIESATGRAACYAAGCGCYKETCYEQSCCFGYSKLLKKQQYSCVAGHGEFIP